MIQRKLVFCIDNNIKFVSGSIPATKLTANDINRDVIYVVAPFEISSVIKVKFADELNEQENVSQLLKYTNEVSVDELVEKTKTYYETVKDWNVYYIEMSGKPLSFVSNRISSGIFLSFSVVITKPKTNLVSGLNFMGYEYGESLENSLNNGEYKIIRNPLFEEDGVSYNVDDIIYKENDNYFRVSASVRKGGTGSKKYLVEPNISAIDESLDPTLTEQIIGMVTDLEQDVAHISRNAVLKDGSVAMEDDLDLGGNSLNNVNEVKVDRISANGGSKIEVINDIDISGNDIGNVANIETNSAYTQRLRVDIIENYNSEAIKVESDINFDPNFVLGVDKIYVKEIRSIGGSGIIEVLDNIDMNGEGIYGVGEVEGEIGTFNNSLTKGGKEVATEEYVDNKDADKLDKIWTDLTNQTTSLLTDEFVLNRGNNVYKTTLATMLSNVAATEIFVVVQELPEIGQINKIYLVISQDSEVQNIYEEFIWVFNEDTEEYEWERIGNASIDLDNYFTKPEITTLLLGKVDKVAGKGLSTNDYTNEDKQNVEKIPTIEQDIVDLENDKVDKNNAITAGTKTKITYDSKGLVTAGADLVATDIPTLEISKITGLQTSLDDKLDKNNAITAGTKTKITYDAKGLVTGGSDLAPSDIPNLDAGKITTGTFGADRIPTLAPSKITQDANNRFVTDAEKSTWNNKQDALTAGDGISISGNVISADSGLTVEEWNTDSKILALSDSNKLFKSSFAGNKIVTIPTNASVPFPIGTMISFLLTDTYKISFFSENFVTLTSMDSLVELATQYAMASLIKTDTDTWQLVGALE